MTYYIFFKNKAHPFETELFLKSVFRAVDWLNQEKHCGDDKNQIHGNYWLLVQRLKDHTNVLHLLAHLLKLRVCGITVTHFKSVFAALLTHLISIWHDRQLNPVQRRLMMIWCLKSLPSHAIVQVSCQTEMHALMLKEKCEDSQ